MKVTAENIGVWAEKWTNGSAEGLALLRIFTSLFILFFLMPGYGFANFEWLATLPSSVFSPPPGPMKLFDGFPSTEVFFIINVLLVAALLGMLVGFKTRFSSLASAVLILFLQGWIYSIGKTNHEIMIAVVPAVMAFSNWGCVWSLDEVVNQHTQRKVDTRVLPFLAIILGFMMFTAGFPKILGGWLNPDTQASYGHLLNQYFVKDRSAFIAGYLVQLKSLVFWELMDWVTVLFEIGFFAAVYKYRWYRCFLGFAVLFHLSTLMSLNIAFVPNFLAYAVFLNWDKIAQFIRNRLETDNLKLPVVFTLLLISVFIPVKWISAGDIFFQNSELFFYEAFVPIAAMFIVLTVVLLHFRARKRKVSQKYQNT